MKANELMIGDWVQHPRFNPFKVEEIETQYGIINPEYTSIYTHGSIDLIGFKVIDELEPVPLTPEIVFKNLDREYPSEYTTCCRIVYLGEYPNSIEITVYSSGEIEWTINDCEYTILPLKYVHELQHALRLAGIEKEIVL
jgi:hypothetical protein